MGSSSFLMLYFNKGAQLGGAGSMLCRLAEGLPEKGIQVTVLANRNGAVFDRLCRAGQVEVYGIDCASKRQMLSKYGTINAKIRRIICRNQIDLLWSPNIYHLPFFIPQLHGAIKVLCSHFLHYEGIVAKMMYILEYVVSDVMIYEYDEHASNIIRAEWFSNSPKNYVIPTGREFSTIPVVQSDGDDSLFTIGMVGQVCHRKGIMDVIRAVKGLRDQADVDCPHIRIVGDVTTPTQSEYKGEVCCQIEENNMSDLVEWVGWVDDVGSELEKMDIFVLASYAEGLSGALREAAAAALPIVATDVGGSGEVVTNGYNGILVQPGDVSGLADAIRKVSSDYEMYKNNASSRSRTVRERYSLESYIDKYANLINSLKGGGDDNINNEAIVE